MAVYVVGSLQPRHQMAGLLLLQKLRYQRYYLKQVDRDSSFTTTTTTTTKYWRMSASWDLTIKRGVPGTDSVSADTLETMSSDEAFPPATTASLSHPILPGLFTKDWNTFYSILFIYFLSSVFPKQYFKWIRDTDNGKAMGVVQGLRTSWLAIHCRLCYLEKIL